MDFEIEPTVGVRGLPLGSSREAARRFFGTQPRVFQRTPNDNPADYWRDPGVFAYYDGEGRLEALEFASSAEVKLDGNSLTATSMERAVRFLRSLDPNLSMTEAGASATSSRLGVGLWCPTPGERDARVESVIVFGRGYYD